jgi:hypothetical protein
MAAGGIVIAQYAGTTLADADGIAAGQSIAAGGSFTLNGSLVVGGEWSNEGWGYKVTAVSAGNDTGKTLYLTGRFYTSNSVGGYTDSATVTLANAGTATSTVYATRITAARVETATASSVTIGLAADGSGVPVGLNHGTLYQISGGGTFGGATVQVKRYFDLTDEWLAFGTETGDTAAFCRNYEIPAGTTMKAFLTTGSTTTALGIKAEIISKQK